MPEQQLIPRIVDLSISIFARIPQIQESAYYTFLEGRLKEEIPPLDKAYIKSYVGLAIERLQINSVLRTTNFAEFADFMITRSEDEILRAFFLVQGATESPELMGLLLSKGLITQEQYDRLVPNT